MTDVTEGTQAPSDDETVIETNTPENEDDLDTGADQDDTEQEEQEDEAEDAPEDDADEGSTNKKFNPKQQKIFDREIGKVNLKRYEAESKLEALSAELADYKARDAAKNVLDLSAIPEEYHPALEAAYVQGTKQGTEAKGFIERVDSVAEEIKARPNGARILDEASRVIGVVAGNRGNAIINEVIQHPNAADLYLQLTKNPTELKRLSQLDDVSLAREITRQAAKPVVKPVSKAPPPIKPQAGSSKPSTDLDRLPMADFAAMRDQQDRERQKR